jgi:glycerol uptake facilitator protein
MEFKAYFGEFVGTFILTSIGCSAVAFDILFGAFSSIIQVALLWGLGVALAIYVVKPYSKAHLNPAVSLGFALLKESPVKQFLSNCFFQLTGGIMAGLFVYLIFVSSIEEFELIENIKRTDIDGQKTASIFGEFFPNPMNKSLESLSPLVAFFYEFFGTFILMTAILFFRSFDKLSKISPILVGLTVALLIIWIAPFTQCGINPARDFGPRLVAYVLKWGDYAFPRPKFSFLFVYILAPLFGAALSSISFRYYKTLVTQFNASRT